MGSTSSRELDRYKQEIETNGSYDFGKNLEECQQISKELTKSTGFQYECTNWSDSPSYIHAELNKSSFDNKR